MSFSRVSLRRGPFLLCGLLAFVLTGCAFLPVNNYEPMGIRELDGRVQLLVCSGISIERISVVLLPAEQGTMERDIVSWAGRYDARANGVVELNDFLATSVVQDSSGFEGLGIDEGSELSVILTDRRSDLGNQVTRFRLDDPLPIGPDWLGSEGSMGPDPCDAG